MKKKITIVIKTFNRKNTLIRLLKSISINYKELPIIIVDDSKKNYKKEILERFPMLDIDYVVEEFDIGLSKGRNILINRVKTPYFLLCDDDFEFDERTDVFKYLNICEEKGLDILGGAVYNRMFIDSIYSFLWTIKDFNRIKSVLKKEEMVSIYNGKYTVDGKNILVKIDNNPKHFEGKDLYDTDICSNFFIGNTKKIVSIGGWTPELLKVGEHEFFFLKAYKNKLKIMYSPNFGVVHYPKKTLGYVKFRGRASNLFCQACKKEKIDSFIVDIYGKYKYYYKRDD